MGYYPIFVQLDQVPVLIVGGGSVAQRKIEFLLEYNAEITIISSILNSKLKAMVEAGKVHWKGRNFSEKDLEGIFLVIAATDDKELNHKISVSAKKRGLLVNAVDQPDDCNFIVPSVVRRGNLAIAISTSGKSPAFAKKIRKKLGKQFGLEYDSFLVLMGHIREEVLSLGLTQAENSSLFKRLVDSDIVEAIGQDNWSKVKFRLEEILPGGLSAERILNSLG